MLVNKLNACIVVILVSSCMISHASQNKIPKHRSDPQNLFETLKSLAPEKISSERKIQPTDSLTDLQKMAVQNPYLARQLSRTYAELTTQKEQLQEAIRRNQLQQCKGFNLFETFMQWKMLHDQAQQLDHELSLQLIRAACHRPVSGIESFRGFLATLPVIAKSDTKEEKYSPCDIPAVNRMRSSSITEDTRGFPTSHFAAILITSIPKNASGSDEGKPN